MSVSIPDFWKLLGASKLLSAQQVQQLAAEFNQQGSADPANARPLAQWLVSTKKLSRYQATVLLAGRQGPFYFGDYKVYDRIDQGRLSGCFRAIHAATGHPVLLHFLTGAAAGDAVQWSGAGDRAWAMSSISSPHVQRIFEPAEVQSFKFVACEDLRGGSLEEKLAAGLLPPAEACRIARSAALGLAQIHEARCVHGDVRPANLWLAAAGNLPAPVKLIVDPLQGPRPFDHIQQQAGGRALLLADFLAPELAAPGREPDALTDIYAVGCTLYTLLAGQPPFSGGDAKHKLARHASEAIQPLEPLGVPPALAKIVAFAMAKKPSVRFQSGTALAEQLAPFIEAVALRLQAPAPPPTLAAYEPAIQQKRDSLPTAKSTPTRSVSEVHFEPTIPTQSVSEGPAEPTIGIQVGGPARPARSSVAEIMRRRKQQQRRNLAIGLTLLVVLLAGGGAAGFFFQDQIRLRIAEVTGGARPAATNVENDSSGQLTTTSNVKPIEPSAPAATDDNDAPPLASNTASPADGHALWASPTSGAPISFRCVPPEAQVFLAVRPADLLSSEEGRRVIAALGPTFVTQRQAFESASGFQLDEVEHLLLTLHNNDGQFPRTSFVVKTKESFTSEQLLARWANPAAAEEKSQKYYTGSAWAYYIPSAPEDERTFAMGDARDIKEVAAAAGQPPVVFRDIERLRRTTDSQRQFTLLFYPQFLFNDDGEPLFAAERAKVRQPLSALLGDHVQAATASIHLGEQFYCELRMLASLDKEPYQLAQELRDRLSKTPAALEDYFVALNPPPYWKKLAFRYPSMVRDLHEHLRIGVENEQAIANSVLPVSAAHNLVLGGELLVSTSPGPVAAVAAAPAASGPKTIEDALQSKTSYSFDSQSLEFAMSGLADDVKSNLQGAPFEFAIKIIGGDLEKDGITRNQTVRDFKQENQTVADILTALVRKANPITTVKDPSEPDQKLVWVIAPDPDRPAKQIVLITTRTAAATKKYTLPSPFIAKKK